MQYQELLKLDAREIAAEPNPCRKAWGPGPAGKRCKHCLWLYSKIFANKYYKCKMRGLDTNGPGTDHRVNWLACGKFEDLKEEP